jgi:hypothetical protein
MEKVYDNFHLLLHDRYRNGGPLQPEADMILRMARHTLESATLIKHFNREKVIRDLMDEWNKGGLGVSTDRRIVVALELGMLLNVEFFKVVVDDMLLVSAFEMHAKAALLKKGYIVHYVEFPLDLKKTQKSRPIHVRTVRAMVKKVNIPKFSQKTLGLSDLLRDEYVLHYPLSQLERKGLKEAIERRNLIHFHTGTAYNVTHALLALAKHLMSIIPLNNSVNLNKSIRQAKKTNRAETCKPKNCIY